MGIISVLGRLLSGVVGFFPGLHRYALYGLAAVSVVGMVSVYAFSKGVEGKGAAVARAEAACAVKIADAETAAERAIAEVLSEVNSITDTSENVGEYCKKHPGLCRSEK